MIEVTQTTRLNFGIQVDRQLFEQETLNWESLVQESLDEAFFVGIG